MADVYISYAREDRDIARKLAQFLETKRYTVWWDKNLDTLSDFSDDLFHQLRVARAVVVIWSPRSVRSRFVRTEARMGLRDQKLISLRHNLAITDLRSPFKKLDSEHVYNWENILFPIASLVARSPGVKLNWGDRASKILKWIGIVGAAASFLVLLGSFPQAPNLAPTFGFTLAISLLLIATSGRLKYRYNPNGRLLQLLLYILLSIITVMITANVGGVDYIRGVILLYPAAYVYYCAGRRHRILHFVSALSVFLLFMALEKIAETYIQTGNNVIWK